MSVLLTCHNVAKIFGSRTLFRNISAALHEGERLGLIGPNGSGKSTLMQILAGVVEPDEGTRSLRKQTKLGYVPQDSTFANVPVRQILLEALKGTPGDETEHETMAAMALSRAGFERHDVLSSELSGGWKKRLAIASEMVKQPDILLLDEPTNHLDLEGIIWLEKILTSGQMASMVISHDRYFLENVATSMAEIHRMYPEGMFEAEGNYSEFLIRREEWVEAQAKYQDALANKVRREVEWLRRGPKARTTKSKARIDAANEMISELRDMEARSVKASAQIDFTASDRKTKKLVEGEGLSKSFGEQVLFRDLKFALTAGMRLGLVGANGSGKSTLLKMIAGEVEPDAGTLNTAEFLKVVSFEQNRATLDGSLTLRRALAPEGDSVIFRGRPIHVNGWAKRFLFQAEQMEMPVSALSGGERARVHIARLMLMEADLLLLDEPTNDLDIPTLEVLEDNLLDFPGALVLVTHDRYLLDRVSTIVLALNGDGTYGLFADYSQWEAAQAEKKAPKAVKVEEPAAQAAVSAPKKKLSYMEQREWDAIEGKIEGAEVELAAAQAAMNDPAVVSDGTKVQQAYARMEAAQAAVDQLYARWAELEAKIS